MSIPQTDLQAFLTQEAEKVRGTYYPIHTGWLRRKLIRKARCTDLHPNPYDEICNPKIGPHEGILSKYERQFRAAGGSLNPMDYPRDGAAEPLIVQRTAPDGYMILNGHHRWIAASRTGVRALRIEIVDLTLQSDVHRILQKTKNTKRAVLDMDEVIILPGVDAAQKRQITRIRKEHIRKGIPALLHYLGDRRYDIWVYTAGYYSTDDIRRLFKRFRMPVTGIVTGMGRKKPDGVDMVQELSKLMESTYRSATHIGQDLVFRTTVGQHGIETYDLTADPDTWSLRVMDIIDVMEKKE